MSISVDQYEVTFQFFEKLKYKSHEFKREREMLSCGLLSIRKQCIRDWPFYLRNVKLSRTNSHTQMHTQLVALLSIETLFYFVSPCIKISTLSILLNGAISHVRIVVKWGKLIKILSSCVTYILWLFKRKCLFVIRRQEEDFLPYTQSAAKI